ncbi:MAG: hypothetical protein OEW83_09905 [Acidimicrobiia bacterium]|nr:hypothetical protein [Acidimicrobiia bacterium]
MTSDDDGVAADSMPFSARSLALSLLLGTHPPRLSTSVLVAGGSLFGINAGTMRTALSRMSAKGEVAATADGYELAGRLIERQLRQDQGRRSPTPEWDGRWCVITPLHAARQLADRRDLRRRLERAGFGELRPDFWLRPVNRDLPDFGSDLLVTVGELRVDNLDSLVERLWPVADLEAEAERLLAETRRATRREAELDGGDPEPDLDSWLVETFTVSAGIVRFLTSEPRLPPSLVAQPWAPDVLRRDYNGLERLFQGHLARYLRRQQEAVTSPAAAESRR